MRLQGMQLPSTMASSVTADFLIQATTAPCPRRMHRRDNAKPLGLLSTDGVRLSAWLYEPDAPVATTVLAHGYRDDRRQLLKLVPGLVARKHRVLAFDFRAHGESDGDRITLGVQETKDVGGVIQWARDFGQPVHYVGFSMGAAAYLLGPHRADFAVLDSPYDTLRAAVEARLRTFGAPRGLLDEVVRKSEAIFGGPIDTFKPIDGAASLEHPALFIFCSGDFWVRLDARKNFARVLPPGASLVSMLGMGHSLHFTRRWRERVTDFLTQTPTNLNQSTPRSFLPCRTTKLAPKVGVLPVKHSRFAYLIVGTIFAAFAAVVACDGDDDGAGKRCPPVAKPAFFVTVVAYGNKTLPDDTKITVRYGGSGTESFALNAPSNNPKVLYCGVVAKGDSLDGGVQDAGSVTDNIGTLACELWTDGAASVDVTATGFDKLHDELEAQFDDCERIKTTPIELKLLLPDGGVGSNDLANE